MPRGREVRPAGADPPAIPLVIRFAVFYDEPLDRALCLGVFHAVSAFNNAGVALFTDILMPFATDPWICFPIATAPIVGGIGFPVLFALGRRLRSQGHRWSLHIKITVITYAVLLVVGILAFLGFEWANPATIGDRDVAGKLVIGVFHGVMPRTAGSISIDSGQLNPTMRRDVDRFSTADLMMISSASGGRTARAASARPFRVSRRGRTRPPARLAGRGHDQVTWRGGFS